MNQFLSSFSSFVFIMGSFGVIAILIVLWNYKRHEVEDILSLEDVAFVDPQSRKCLLRFYLPKGWTYEDGDKIPKHIMRKLDRRSFRFTKGDETRSAHIVNPHIGQYLHFLVRHEDGTVHRQSLITKENFRDDNEHKNKIFIVLVCLTS
jgi:hypothetical protein